MHVFCFLNKQTNDTTNEGEIRLVDTGSLTGEEWVYGFLFSIIWGRSYSTEVLPTSIGRFMSGDWHTIPKTCDKETVLLKTRPVNLFLGGNIMQFSFINPLVN